MAEGENRAVFLSYASQDGEVAGRICEALRAAGIEVWFDRNELRGGDAWDAKIKGRIRDCALFVAVISANTQARREGYFRLEWKLAEDRSHLMAKGTPFIVPVSVDGTSERGALVPEAFLAVQWMRLAGGEVTTEFVGRVGELLGDEEIVGAAEEKRGGGAAAPASQTATLKVGRRVPAAAWVGVIAVIALGVGATFLATRKAEPASAVIPNADAGTRPATSEKPTEPRRGAKSIAVLPFDNLSEDKEASLFFSDGMHQDVITNLLLIRELACVPHTTAMSYRGSKKSNREIADELGVAFVLTGSVRRAQDEVRITAALINPRTDEAMWTKVYDKGLTKIFAVQAELAQAIAGELKAVLSPQEKKLVERRPTEDLEAYDLFLKVRARRIRPITNRRTLDSLAELLDDAVARDPRFAVAWAELAWVHSYAYFANYDHADGRLAKAKVAIDTAKRLQPDAPEVMLNLGWFYYLCSRDFERATEQFTPLILLQPNAPGPRFALANIQRRQGRWVAALASFRKVAELDPTYLDNLGQILLLTRAGRQYGEARDAVRRYEAAQRAQAVPNDPDQLTPEERTQWLLAKFSTLERGETKEMDEFLVRVASERPTFAGLHPLRVDEAMQRGDATEVGRLYALRPDTSPAGVLGAAVALASAGDLEAARAKLTGLPQKLRERLMSEPANDQLWGQLARVEALLGNKEEALRCVREAEALLPFAADAWAGTRAEMSVAFVYAWTGEKARAVDTYARLLFRPSELSGQTNNTLNVHVLRRGVWYAPLRGDPRFEAMLNDPKNNAPLF